MSLVVAERPALAEALFCASNCGTTCNTERDEERSHAHDRGNDTSLHLCANTKPAHFWSSVLKFMIIRLGYYVAASAVARALADSSATRTCTSELCELPTGSAPTARRNPDSLLSINFTRERSREEKITRSPTRPPYNVHKVHEVHRRTAHDSLATRVDERIFFKVDAVTRA